MAVIVTRAGKGSPLTNNEVDANFINLNTELGLKASAGANSDITSMSGITGGISTADYIDIDTAATPTGAVARMRWDDGNGTLQIGMKGGNVNLQVGQEMLARVYNDSGAALTDGQIVYISGSQGNRIAVKLANANSEATSAGTLGMVTEPIAIGAEGFINLMGVVNRLNTSALTAGQLVYLSTTAGAYTTTAPLPPNHRVIVGYVERVHATVGSIYVKVDNGYELEELHNVSITSLANNDILQYESASSLWKNVAALNGVPVGTTTASSGAFTTLTTTSTVNGLTVGKGAGSVATNTAVGASALAANTTGASSTAVGYQAGLSNTTGAITAVGAQALRSNTTGQSNTAVGGTYNANPPLYANTTGSYNSAFGEGALASNTTASNNTAVGYQAGYTNATGVGNTFIGYQAGYGYNSATDGYNVAIGVSSGIGLTTGVRNTLIGVDSGGLITTGGRNSILGRYNGNQGGLDIRTASNYIVLSDGDGNPRGWFGPAGEYNVNVPGITPWRGQVSVQSDSNSYYQLALNNSNTGGGGQIMLDLYRVGSRVGSISANNTTTSYNTSSDYRLKENVQPMAGALSRVSALKPCTYNWKSDGSTGEGFIAHELAEVIPQAVHGEKDAVNEDNSIEPQSIDTSHLVAMLTAAIQELNAKVDAQAAEIAALKGQP